MEDKNNNLFYVYCHNCEKLIGKYATRELAIQASQAHRNKIEGNDSEKCLVFVGTKERFNIIRSKVNTNNW